jgi:hypothetical protein
VQDTFLLTILGLAAVALVGTFISGRMRDRCLKGFDKFLVTLETTDGKVIWGTLGVHATGIELTYQSDYLNRDHVESSFLLYEDEFESKMFLLARYHSDLDEKARSRRDRILNRTYRPHVLRRMWRSIRNAANTVKDSLNNLVSLLIGQAARRRPGSALLATQQAEFTKVGQTVLGSVGTSYDPMLERRVGTKVVFEFDRDGSVREYVGILKEYSSNFIEVLDVEYPSHTAVKVDRGMGRLLSKGVVCDLEGDSLEIRNGSPEPITIDTVIAAEEIGLDKTIPSGDTWRTELPPGCGEVEVSARTFRKADLLIPRTRAVVRHQSERLKPRDS